ncbi:MAG: hypothetical protein BWY56_02311 [Acidobacteria bacterium ADurb.Bin340]|nr:MAG: hypothetical protein BWY56_02311 [Acidobacteria bacterium ADurb.Bin340]
MPRNIVPSSAIIQIIVFAAFFPAGSLKAVTPSLMASTPVNAVQPAEKARMKIHTRAQPVTVCAWPMAWTTSGPLGATGAPPSHRAKPVPSSRNMSTAKP